MNKKHAEQTKYGRKTSHLRHLNHAVLLHLSSPHAHVHLPSLVSFFCVLAFRVGGGRYNREEADPADSVLFANATNATEDLSNAFALDMTYRVLYYGMGNQVRRAVK